MDSKFHKVDLSATYFSNAFKNLRDSFQVGGSGAEYSMDTVLRLDSPGSLFPYMPTSKGIKRKWNLIDGPMGQQIGSSLSLRLGHSSSSSDSKGSSATACSTMSSAKETDEESSMDLELDFSLHLGNEKVPIPFKTTSSSLKAQRFLPKVDLELSLSTGPSESDITTVNTISTPLHFPMSMPVAAIDALNADEGSTSCSIHLPAEHPPFHINLVPKKADPISIIPDGLDLTSSAITVPKSSLTCTSSEMTHPQHRSTSSKTCQVEGCGKRARGASGHCISHGGGRRCQKLGCHKGAEGRTVYCKAHGGGRRCEHLGCTKSAEGRTEYCIAHGGGRRCNKEGCARAARGKSGLCIRHGGGKRCQMENCTKSAEGLSGLCISHGGGRRCQALGCTKGAQGSTIFCKAHGGGKRCTALGCTKGAEGSTPFCKGHGGGKRCAFQGGGICTKSVHGGTNFCVAHGGGKRCAIPECTKSARGRTDYCVRHGGGKRCKYEGCGKSAQGSTDFCKAHGGGKRCSWGYYGSEYGTQLGPPCTSFARGKTGLCALHSGLVQDKRVHGGVTLGPITNDLKVKKPEKMKEVVVVEDMNIDPAINVQKPYGFLGGDNLIGEGSGLSAPLLVPEGRVHGGSLLAMLAGSSVPSYSTPHSWM